MRAKSILSLFMESQQQQKNLEICLYETWLRCIYIFVYNICHISGLFKFVFNTDA